MPRRMACLVLAIQQRQNQLPQVSHARGAVVVRQRLQRGARRLGALARAAQQLQLHQGTAAHRESCRQPEAPVSGLAAAAQHWLRSRSARGLHSPPHQAWRAEHLREPGAFLLTDDPSHTV